MSQQGKMTINGKDAYTTWGAYLLDGGVSALMTPAPAKAYITNESRLQHGKRVTRKDSKGNSLYRAADRDVTLQFAISAPDRATLGTRLSSFVAELEADTVALKTSWQPGVVYHLDYVSCTEFAQYGTLAKYAIKFNEPNPKNRT